MNFIKQLPKQILAIIKRLLYNDMSISLQKIKNNISIIIVIILHNFTAVIDV